VFVEGLNLLARRRRVKPVHLRQSYAEEPGTRKSDNDG
jgi:hypothetical protein